jgi:hypothetical protein
MQHCILNHESFSGWTKTLARPQFYSITKTEKPCPINHITTLIIKQLRISPQEKTTVGYLTTCMLTESTEHFSMWQYDPTKFTWKMAGMSHLCNASYLSCILHIILTWNRYTFVKAVQHKLESDVIGSKICRRHLTLSMNSNENNNESNWNHSFQLLTNTSVNNRTVFLVL